MILKGDKKTIRAWAMYDWANSVYALVITSAVFPVFYEGVTIQDGVDKVKDVTGIMNLSLYSYAVAAAFLIIALIAPMLSGIADYAGRKKIFLKFFCYMGAICCSGLYFFSTDYIWIGMILICFAGIGWSGSVLFYNSFLPLIADKDHHDKISAYGFSLGYTGSVLLLLLNLYMIIFQKGFFSENLPGYFAEDGKLNASRASFFLVGVWWAGFAQITFRKLKEPKTDRKINRKIFWSGYKEVRNVFIQVLKTKRLKRYLIAFFTYNIAVQTVLYLAAGFAAKEILKMDGTKFETENLIITILIIQLVGIGGAYLFSWMSSKMGNIRTLIVIICVWLVICVWGYFVKYEYSFYGLAVLVGIVMGGVQSLSRSTYSKFIPMTNDTASFFSFYNVCYFIGTFIGMMVFGYVSDQIGERAAIMVMGIIFVLGIIALLRVPRQEVELEAA